MCDFDSVSLYVAPDPAGRRRRPALNNKLGRKFVIIPSNHGNEILSGKIEHQ